MSTVEKAIQKLRDAAGSAASARQPIAAVTSALDAAGSPRAGRPPAKTVQLDIDTFGDAWLHAPDNQALADQYRVIKRALLAKAAAPASDVPPRANFVAVSSAFAGEGKTFTCMNLALSIATEKDWRVLLIDGDCKNPQLSGLLGADGQRGLLDVLKSDDLHADDVILATSIPGLAMMPLGNRDDHAAELFASARMAALCDELAQSDARQLVLFDTSPLLLTTESVVMAGHCGQVVVVVKAGSTSQHAVLSAVHKLDAEKAIGLVLNCANENANALQYGRYGTYPHVEA